MNSRKQEVISRTGKFSFSSLHVYIMYQKPENGRTDVFTILYIRFYQNLLSLFEQTRLYLTLLAFMGSHLLIQGQFTVWPFKTLFTKPQQSVRQWGPLANDNEDKCLQKVLININSVITKDETTLSAP